MKPLKLNSNLIKLVNILNDGQYHDGTTIGKSLNMTRSAVWKTIRKLTGYGIKIDSIKGKGYALQEPLILLNKQAIWKGLTHQNIEIEAVENITSTNDYLKSFFHHATPRICIAEQQTAGKGRFQRNWYAPFGKNIYLSCLYPFQMDVSEVTGLSLVISLAIIKTCHATALPKSILVKWPNDVLYQEKKLAGNLIELQAESYGTCAAVIGIGINVNMLSTENHPISQAWTSLREITGKYIDRNSLLILLINNLFIYLQRFEKQGLAGFIKEWEEVDCLLGKKVTLQGINNKISGIVTGIDKHGHLVMKLKDGTTRSYASGDTTIMKK